MKIYGEKKYNIISADDPMLEGKTFESPSKTKFQKGIDVWFGDVLKISMPNGGVLTTRNSDHTFYNETFASGDVIYVAIGDGLDSIELPSGASAEIAKTATRNSGGSSAVGGVTSWNDLTDKPFYTEGGIVKVLDHTININDPISASYVTKEFSLVEGNEYIIELSGVQYKSVAVLISDETDGDIIAIGNLTLIGLESGSDIPLVMMRLVEPWVEDGLTVYGNFRIASEDFISEGVTEYPLLIYKNDEIVHKIEEKYLPETPRAYLNVVSETPYLYTDSTYTTKLTKDEVIELAEKNGKVLYTHDGVTVFCTILNFVVKDDCAIVIISVGGSQISLYSSEYTG